MSRAAAVTPTRPRWRARLHEVIFEADTAAGRAFDVALLVAIAVSVAAVLLESMADVRVQYGPALHVAEWDLLEYSAVPIPEHPGALTVALQKGLVRDTALRDWLALLPDERGGHLWRAFDVMSELI